ncbi:histidine--tRNA ligase [Rhizobium sp. EC-SD404]|uniref:histidine--tRNA ligase n=1 Tax=Rhizobium sp. EC-SD404 TaxID=2038389 RepID=UPI001259D4B9|nr:histidine--tRNA ligase [Rhizobium sp. EC-SD404]VVT06908.1 Histidine--tRNA ligase [Rhizobium sp. EC-SD404]
MSDKKKKPQKLKARLPRGFGDRSPADIRATDEMVAKIKAVYERYGFDPVETPMFEYTDALGKFLPDSDRPNEGVFSLTDDDEQWMSLRYDLTAPLARHVAENFNDIQLPYRTYRAGWVFRNEKPGPGRFRQFMQFDADTVGAPGVQADAEMCMMMADVMEALGIARGDYVIRVNNRKVLDGVLEAIGLGGDDNAEKRLTVLRAIDKLDKFGVGGVQQLLGAGRKDESGDFTKGAGLDEEQQQRLVDFIVAAQHGGTETFFADLEATKIASSSRGLEGLEELKDMSTLFYSAQYGGDRIRIDPSCVRGLEYYTGPVFEAELLAEIPNEKGEIVRFGSVGGGGRYDGLVSRFMGQPVPATGFSIGVSRLMTALKNLGKLGQDQVAAPVLVTVMDRDIEALGRYQRFTQELRNAGIRAEMFQGNPKNFGNQLKYADRRDCPIAIIQGGDEREQGVVQIKDLIEGKRASQGIEDNAAWREARVAQVTVPESELVAKVREMLAAQDEDRAKDRMGVA